MAVQCMSCGRYGDGIICSSCERDEEIRNTAREAAKKEAETAFPFPPGRITKLNIYFWGGYDSIPNLPYKREEEIPVDRMYFVISEIITAGYNVMLRSISLETPGNWGLLVDIGNFIRH